MPQRIAVFNHSSNILLLIESVLKKKGFEVFTFLETLTDVSRVTELSPDLVIIGHVKGFNDGEAEIIHQFRADPNTAHVPIIVCTTGAAHVRESGTLDGVSYVTIVPKPFSVQDLMNAVMSALEVRSNGAELTAGNTAVSDSVIL